MHTASLVIALAFPSLALADAASATAVRNAATSTYSTAKVNSSATAVAITAYIASNRSNELKMNAISAASQHLLYAFDAGKTVSGAITVGDGFYNAGQYDKAESTYVAGLKASQDFLYFDTLARQLYSVALKTAAAIDAGLYK